MRTNTQKPWKIKENYDLGLYVYLMKQGISEMENLVNTETNRRTDEKKAILRKIGLGRISRKTPLDTTRSYRVHQAVLRCLGEARDYLEKHRPSYDEDLREGRSELIYPEQREFETTETLFVGNNQPFGDPRNILMTELYRDSESVQRIKEEEIPF